jgi:hypothetical protein
MPKGLTRRYGQGHLHFITCSCYRRLPQLGRGGFEVAMATLRMQTRGEKRGKDEPREKNIPAMDIHELWPHENHPKGKDIKL